jgi:hypothetical protein
MNISKIITSGRQEIIKEKISCGKVRSFEIYFWVRVLF